MEFIRNIVNFFKNTSQLNQRVFFGILMIFIFGVPLILGGKVFVAMLFCLCVLVVSEYVAICKQPQFSVLAFIMFEFIAVYLLRNSDFGFQKLVFLAFIIAMFDSSAYFVGKSIGKTKLCPNISPGKTVEGFVGGILCVTVFSFAIYYVLGCNIPLPFYFLMVACLATLSQLGDVLESAFKRKHEVKDSSTLIPGHGGVLDRFDGYILTIPAFLLINAVLTITKINLF